jgi:protein required for attachment to host cells
MSSITWVLVTDASRARIFEVNARAKGWKLVRELAHPESRAHGRDIVSDKAGHTNLSAMEPPTPPKEVEAEHFAGDLAAQLTRGLGPSGYSRLVLVAPPHFLGLLRARLPAQVQKRVSASLDKDYTLVEARDLPKRLADLV